jgi:hypothetical protein
MSSPIPRWQPMPEKPDAWSTRFPADYVQGDLAPADLAAWRDMARAEEAAGYLIPFSDKPSAGQVKHGREMDNCPSLRWMRGRVQ